MGDVLTVSRSSIIMSYHHSISSNPFVDPQSGGEDNVGSRVSTNPFVTPEDHNLEFFDSATSVNLRPTTSKLVHVPVKGECLTKWGLTFSGKSCVREFFSLVEEQGVARGVGPSYVVLRFHELLADSALKYFRAIRYPGLTFAELKAAFFKTFDVLDYEFKIESQLRALRQKSNQSVLDFVICARDLNTKLLSPISERDLFLIIKYGLHPQYHACLATNLISDLDGLLEVAKNFESFRGRQTSNLSLAPIESEAIAVCLKCNVAGHHYRLCPNITGPACFKCKRVGAITRDCPQCAPGSSKN